MNEQRTDRTRTISWQDPAMGLEKSKSLSGLDYFKSVRSGEIPAPPISILMDFELTEVEEGRVVFTMRPGEYQYNPLGTVHGGITATLLDSAMGCAVHTTLPVGAGYTTLEIKVNYIRAMTSKTGIVSCEGKVIYVGGRTATAEARVTDEQGKLYAHATTTCILFRP